MISVRGTLLHGGLRKGNPDSQVMIGFYRSPGIAGESYTGIAVHQQAHDDVVHLRQWREAEQRMAQALQARP